MIDRSYDKTSVKPPIMEHVRKLMNGHCDSLTLDLQKFPDVGRKMKAAELGDFCSRARRNRVSATRSGLPAIPGARKFQAVNRGRLLVNHTGGIIENCNLAFHRFFGFPIISGSALKGIARSAASADGDSARFARVFGGVDKGKSERAGSVAFLAAFPADDGWNLAVDVLTSHHGCDTRNPTPVFFPAVEAGAVFDFMIAPTARTEDGDLEFAERYLKLALTENGVGAKTAAGYGWFEIKGSR